MMMCKQEIDRSAAVEEFNGNTTNSTIGALEAGRRGME